MRSAPDWRKEDAYLKAIHNRRATQPLAHFHRKPPGRGRLAVFPSGAADPYVSIKIRSSIPPVLLGPP
jgi:hypothetical protein